jgi:hypothetical protein
MGLSKYGKRDEGCLGYERLYETWRGKRSKIIPEEEVKIGRIGWHTV